MSVKESIEQLLEAKGGVITVGDALAVGASRAYVAKLAKAGVLERVAHGVYARPGEVYDELYVLSLRSERIVFSHETALWLNGLSDRAPLEWHVVLPTRSPLGDVLRHDCRCHYVKPELHMLGVVARKTAFGHEVKCCGPERTICDLVRHEKRVGVEALAGGLKAYAASKEKDLPALIEMARAFSVERRVSGYMGVLL